MQRDFRGQVLKRFTAEQLKTLSVFNTLNIFEGRLLNRMELNKHYQGYLKDRYFLSYDIKNYIEDAKTDKSSFPDYTCEEYLIYFILELNLEQLPLYMNITELIDEIVRFRLKLNK